jgi:ribosomal protein L11 methylase PrmA
MFWFLISALVISVFWMIVGIMFYIVPLFFGAPYEGTANKKIEDIIEISKIKKGEKIVDLGSGDGRIVIAFAKKGVESHGYEINPLLVLASRYKIKKLKLNNAFIHWKSFWKSDLGKYDAIILFQYKTLMENIEEKLKKELGRNSKIISYHWKFPNLKIKKNIGDVYLYKF